MHYMQRIIDLLMLCLQLKPVTIGRLFELNADVESTRHTVQSSTADNSVGILLHKLIWGQLIYPWIELNSKH